VKILFQNADTNAMKFLCSNGLYFCSNSGSGRHNVRPSLRINNRTCDYYAHDRFEVAVLQCKALLTAGFLVVIDVHVYWAYLHPAKQKRESYITISICHLAFFFLLIIREITQAGTSTTRGHSGCIFKAIADCRFRLRNVTLTLALVLVLNRFGMRFAYVYVYVRLIYIYN
jgi:hypothetical protein